MRRETTIFLTTIMALVLVGVLMAYSINTVTKPINFYTHIVYVMLGFVAMSVASRFDYHRLRDKGIFRSVVIFAVILLILVLIPGLGIKVNGARRWLSIASFRFQPSEFAKLALILLLAVKLSENQDRIKSFRYGFIPPMLTVMFLAGLVYLEGDLGTPVIMVCMGCAMILMAGTRIRYLIYSVIPLASVAFSLVWFSKYRVYRLGKIVLFLNPWMDPKDDGYQLIQSLMAFARGGIWGCGPGASEQKLYYLPDAHTDFIFAIWGEEMGLVGSLVVVLLFATALITAFRIASRANDLFGALLASGIATLLGIQAIINMAVGVGLVPTKGLPLPFISYGGSSLITFMTLAGILLNIGLQTEEPESARNYLPA